MLGSISRTLTVVSVLLVHRNTFYLFILLCSAECELSSTHTAVGESANKKHSF